jgi:hypothetical protein
MSKHGNGVYGSSVRGKPSPFKSDRAWALAKVTRKADPRDAMLHCVYRIRKEHGTPQFPLDVRQVADRLGIPITDCPPPCPGFLIRRDDGTFEIKVNMQDPVWRQKFTIAHELGHYLFFQNLPNFDGEDSEADRREEEWLCNLAASEMLMPFRLVKSRLLTDRVDPDLVFGLANELGVSLQALLVRFQAVIRSQVQAPIAFVLWSRLGDDFSPDWTTPCDRRFRFSGFAQEHLARAAETGEPQTGYELCEFNQEELAMSALSWRFGDPGRVLTMLWPRACSKIVDFVCLPSRIGGVRHESATLPVGERAAISSGRYEFPDS